MFSIFNDLNEDDKFDIYCTYSRRPGSRIRQQVCAPNFVKTAEEEIAEFTLKNLGFAGIMAEGPGNTAVTMNYNALQEIMEDFFKEHAEFNQAVNTFNTLVDQYEKLND